MLHSEHTINKNVKQICGCYGGSFSHLDKRSSQPQHSLKPKPASEQDPNSLQFLKAERGEEAAKKGLKVANVGS